MYNTVEKKKNRKDWLNMGKEIEIRYKLNNKPELEEWLNKNARLIHTSHQIDTYYDNKLNSFAKDPEHIYDWLRVREENNNITFNSKYLN